MAFFAWSDGYSVGIRDIDEQHKKLVTLVNQLYEAMQGGKASDVLGTILGELIRYTKYHFSAEEKLMETHAYPELAAHKQEHMDLTEKVIELENKFKAGKVTISLEVGKFLKEWLLRHIQGTDKKYGPYLNSKGVK